MLLILLTPLTLRGEEFEIAGSWQLRDNEILPTQVVFGDDDELIFRAPGLSLGAVCTYEFDAAGSPKALLIHCEPQLALVEGRFWVTVLTDTVIHVRADQLDHADRSSGLLSDTVLDRVLQN